MRELIASARPSDHKVYSIIDKENRVTNGKFYSFCRVRRRILSDHQCTLHLMRQIAKVTLRRVKIIHKLEKIDKW